MPLPASFGKYGYILVDADDTIELAQNGMNFDVELIERILGHVIFAFIL